MTKLNVLDLASIQECLMAYKRIIDWLPCASTNEEDMKQERLGLIKHLMTKCEVMIREASE